MIDFDALVFGPVYDTFGQPAVLTIGSFQLRPRGDRSN
jgi:hypothetical protein